MKHKIQRNLASIMILLTTMLMFVATANAKGIEFPTIINKEGYSFELQGKGYKRVFFMKAFDAGFYTTSGVAKEELLNDVPKFLEVQYHVAIPGKSLTEYTVTHIKRNISKSDFNELKKEIELMGQYFVDLKPHDRFSLTYLPGVGTQFAHNGEVTGVISGDKFGRALFSVWIGDKPFDPVLKKKILGFVSPDEELVEERLAGMDDSIEPSIAVTGEI